MKKTLFPPAGKKWIYFKQLKTAFLDGKPFRDLEEKMFNINDFKIGDEIMLEALLSTAKCHIILAERHFLVKNLRGQAHGHAKPPKAGS